MTDEEWDAIRPILVQHHCGYSDRPRAGVKMQDVRGRLDAIFRAVTRKRTKDGGRASWRTLPPEFGKADTVSRTYRRWATSISGDDGCHGAMPRTPRHRDTAPARGAWRRRRIQPPRPGRTESGVRCLVVFG
jgi:hypothetical protein